MGQEPAKLGIDKAVSRFVSTEATSLVPPAATLDIICENSFRRMSALVDDFRTFGSLEISLDSMQASL
jgi:hypothetical protein